MLERWEFIRFPCTKDAQRYKLKVKADEEDMHKILRMLSVNAGRPFASLSHDYNWGIYFYNVNADEKDRIVSTLRKVCSKGNISHSDITMEQELSPMFEEFLDATAKELTGSGSLTKEDSDAVEEVGVSIGQDEEKTRELEIGKMGDVEEIKFGIDRQTSQDEQEITDASASFGVEGLQPGVSRDVFEQTVQSLEEQESLTIYSSHVPEERVVKPDTDKNISPNRVVPNSTVETSLPLVESENEPESEQVTHFARESGAGKEKPGEQPPADEEVKPKLNKKYTMKEFIVGPNNRFTHAAAKAVADNPGKIYNPLFIYGGVGLGKTHLMHAVGHYLLEKKPSTLVMFVTTERFMSEVIEAIGKGTLRDLREKYRKIDLLLIDDIQFLSESESTQEEFFHTFNMLHENSKQIIITSDRPPKQLATLEDRLRSRFEWGLIADIKSPNLETRMAILKKKSEDVQVKVDDNMLLYIASKLKSNIRELEGFLKRINAYASLTGQNVTLDLVKSIMRELLPEEELEEEASGQKESLKKTVSETMSPAPPAQRPPAEPSVSPNVQQPHENPPNISMPSKPVPPPLSAGVSAPKPSVPQAVPPSLQPAGTGINGISTEEVDPGLTPVEVAFFYPEGKDDEFGVMREKFRQVIKKHKLKFRFESIFERAYDYESKINYAFFTELCKTNNIKIVVVLGLPPNPNVVNDDFLNLLAAMMEDEKISMQYVPWLELNKDFRYLNLALDIALIKNKK